MSIYAIQQQKDTRDDSDHEPVVALLVGAVDVDETVLDLSLHVLQFAQLVQRE